MKQLTYPSKTSLDVNDITADDISIDDICHSLARQCRYNGHLNRDMYSIAQHSLLVATLLLAAKKDVYHILAGLVHDFGEAYLGDIITPVKSMIREDYDRLEMKILDALAKKYGIETCFTEDVWKTVMEYDQLAYRIETYLLREISYEESVIAIEIDPAYTPLADVSVRHTEEALKASFFGLLSSIKEEVPEESRYASIKQKFRAYVDGLEENS